MGSPPREPGPGAAGSKPLDVGNGSLAASFGRTNASLLSVLVPHPGCGTVELSAFPAFDERGRGDAAATWRHRRRMVEDRFACLWLESADGRPFAADEVDSGDPARPVWRGHVGSARSEADAAADVTGVVLTWRVTASTEPRPALTVRFGGRLDRPALAEITETDPPERTGATTILRSTGRRLVVVSRELPATMTIETEEGEWVTAGDAARLEVHWPPGAAAVTISVRCSSETARPDRPPRSIEARKPAVPSDRLVARALAYVRGCTALATAADERVILTDHRILPLSWTRDAYFQALLLLAADDAGDRDRVADHLRWLWRRCERPDGRWARSHHADGRRKDRAFQADQQLYPLLELADFWRRTGSLPGGVDWTAEVATAWSAALREIDPRTGLMACAENAADDPAPAPFIAGSQVMLWYAARRLRELAAAGALAIEVDALDALAAGVRGAFDRALADGNSGWAYATDGRGRRVAYHDANDLPTALAPLWGFCPPGDPGWAATMAWAFSPANPGYAAGTRGGLGSTHTPGPWTLGDIQAWIRARAAGDESGTRAALERLRAVAFDDGMLPEAYSATPDPDVRVRHWFAWPGAALGALLLLDARGELETRLRA